MSAPVNIQPRHHRRNSSVLSHSTFSWSDAFDFSMRSPLSTGANLDMEHYANAYGPQVHQQQPFGMLAPVLGAATPALTAMNLACSPPTEEFEKDYCSNFNCCNLTLPDMHALVAHCEEAHFGFQGSFSVGNSPKNSSSTVAPVPVKPPVLNVDTTNAGLVGSSNMDMDVEASAQFGETNFSHDAPSPYSSVGPETPPPQSLEVGSSTGNSQNKVTSSPEMDRITAPTPMYGNNTLGVFSQFNSNANGRSSAPISSFQRSSPFSHGHAQPHTHSPLASSPLSSGSPASYASGSMDEASIPVLHISATSQAQNSGHGQAPADILMHFDPFDDLDDLPTPLDSTPPSPLSAPTRVRPVLRHASLVQAVPNCPSIGLPPSLFSTYDFMKAEGEEEADDEERERKDREREAREKDERRRAERRERDRERRERQRAAEKERLAALAAANSDSGHESSTTSGGTGGVVRREREKARKQSAIGLSPAPSTSVSRSVPVSPVQPSFSDEQPRRHSDPSTSHTASSETPVSSLPSRAERAAASAFSAAQQTAAVAGKKGVREKAYKCMKPGCTKSYLNPNGLKYHTLKGTCTFAEKPNNGSAPGTPVPVPTVNGVVTPMSTTTPVGSAPGTPSPTVQLPVPFAIPSLTGTGLSEGGLTAQQMQAFAAQAAQGFPAFSVQGMPIIAPAMAPAHAQTA